MKRQMRWMFIMTVVGLAPTLAWGGLLDWLLPVGKIAEVARDITWAVLLKQFLDTWMPLLAMLLIALAAAICGIAAKNTLSELADSYRAAAADGRITGIEAFFLIPLYGIGGIIAIGLVAFMVMFGWLAADVMIDFIAYEPPTTP